MPEPTRRVDYAGSLHDQRETDAVVEVLRGGPTALRIGRNVSSMEDRVAELFAKRRGVMCNSGSPPSTWRRDLSVGRETSAPLEVLLETCSGSVRIRLRAASPAGPRADAGPAESVRDRRGVHSEASPNI